MVNFCFFFLPFGNIVAPSLLLLHLLLLFLLVVVVISLRGVFVAVSGVSGNIKLPQNVCHFCCLCLLLLRFLLLLCPCLVHHLVFSPVPFDMFARLCAGVYLCVCVCVAKVEAFNELKFEACVLEQQQQQLQCS